MSFGCTIMRVFVFGFAVFFCLAGEVVDAADAGAKVARVVEAVGGESKLLKLFRIEEIFHFGDQPEPAEGKKRSTRESVLEMPGLWWIISFGISSTWRGPECCFVDFQIHTFDVFNW